MPGELSAAEYNNSSPVGESTNGHRPGGGNAVAVGEEAQGGSRGTQKDQRGDRQSHRHRIDFAVT